MEYHVFKKPKKLKSGKTVRRRYYYCLDENKKQAQKSCKGCKSRKEAEDYVRALPGAAVPAGRVRIEDIARDMFLDGSAHMGRRIHLGRQTDRCAQLQARIYIKYIIEKWGKMTLAETSPAGITKYLFTVSRSSSWKTAIQAYSAKFTRSRSGTGAALNARASSSLREPRIKRMY
jgi:hypothetical protein